MYCYCPDIGDCEVFKYELPLPLNELSRTTKVDNATYYIQITAVNNAQLSTSKEVEFMIEFTRGKLIHMPSYSWKLYGNHILAHRHSLLKSVLHINNCTCRPIFDKCCLRSTISSTLLLCKRIRNTTYSVLFTYMSCPIQILARQKQ